MDYFLKLSTHVSTSSTWEAFFLCPNQHWGLVFFVVNGSVMDEIWRLIVHLICVFQTIGEVEHLFIYLLTNHLDFLLWIVFWGLNQISCSFLYWFLCLFLINLCIMKFHSHSLMWLQIFFSLLLIFWHCGITYYFKCFSGISFSNQNWLFIYSFGNSSVA